MMGRSVLRMALLIGLWGMIIGGSAAQAGMSYQRDDKEVNLHIRDGVNRLWFEVEIPFHEMGESSKRVAAARALYFLKQDLQQMWKEGKLPTALHQLLDSTVSMGELQYDQIYDRIQSASGAKVRKALEEALPGISKTEPSQLGDVDWWRPSGLLVEVGIRGSVKLSFLKGLSGNFTQVVVPQCVHRIRKIPRQDAEKDKDLQLMLQDYKPNVLDRSYNIILTKMYGRPCTEDIGVLINRIKAHEPATDMEANFYVVEEAYVRSVRRLMFWANTQVGSRSDASPDAKRPSVQTKLRAGFVYGQLRRPEEFAGGTMSYSKTFQLPAATRERIRNWVSSKFPGKFLNLMNYSWGWNGKVGALIWNERFFPYFLTGPEFGTEISSKGAVHPGTVMDVLELLKNSANSVTSAYDGQSAGNTRQDQVSLEEYAQQQAQRRGQTVPQEQAPGGSEQ